MDLTIYMKSGNVITVDKVRKWNIKYNSDEITYLSVLQKTKGLFRCKYRFIAESISLSQIECIVQKN